MRIASIMVAAVLVTSCQFGGRTGNFAPATSPRGVRVTINRSFRGELLLVQDTALLVSSRRGAQDVITLVPFRAIRTADFDKLGPDYDFVGSERPELELLARVRRVSRYPQGLNAEQLGRLLEASGQAAPAAMP